MDIEKIDAQMAEYVRTKEMLGGALIIRHHGAVVLKNTWGYADIKGTKPMQYNAIYRMASMTKPVTAAAVMKCIELGKMDLDDELAKFIPEFAGMRVVTNKKYEYSENNIKKLPWLFLTFNPKKVTTTSTIRPITIRDLLSHSSGLEQGLFGLIALQKRKINNETLEDRALKYAAQPLDFQPGTDASYSPIAGFDVLARVIEMISAMDFAAFVDLHIFKPLGMKDATFHPTHSQRNRIPSLYKFKRSGRIKDVTGSQDDIDARGFIGPNLTSGSAGLYATIEDYDRFVQMLANNGKLNGIPILEPETVKMMHEEGAAEHLEFQPGMSWGLGMLIQQDPQKSKRSLPKGSYGWSGAYGTHFFISPNEDLSLVFTMNRADIGGAESYIAHKLEELVFSSQNEEIS